MVLDADAFVFEEEQEQDDDDNHYKGTITPPQKPLPIRLSPLVVVIKGGARRVHSHHQVPPALLLQYMEFVF
jgi:oxalate decarboxylase/phosphoglucose isomerase-like protein (cupin superfamily)